MTEFEEAGILAHKVLDSHSRYGMDPDADVVILARQFLRAREREDALRAALLPFAAAAGRPGRLVDCMTDKPLPDNAALGLGVTVSVWKKAIELTGLRDIS